jgi:hypothetical protein
MSTRPYPDYPDFSRELDAIDLSPTRNYGKKRFSAYSGNLGFPLLLLFLPFGNLVATSSLTLQP